jgi:phosphinothricin acetyltransferase
VVGWARAGEYSDRCVYAGVGEYAVYVARRARGDGVGRALLRSLAEEAQRRGYYKLLSRIFPENGASLAIARACGFREVGVHRRHGKLDGEWKDTVVVELLLGEAADG